MEKMYILEIDIDGTETRREYTAEEYAQAAKDEKDYQDKVKVFKAREEARLSALAKLAALGLTEEEIAAL